MDRYEEISEDVKGKFKDILDEKSFPVDMKFEFVSDLKQKKLVSLRKIQEVYQFLTKKELLVSINEEIYDKLDDKSIKILFLQEIDKIEVDMNTGKIKLKKPDLTTFSGIVNKYGIEDVARANQVVDLSVEQKEDLEQI